MPFIVPKTPLRDVDADAPVVEQGIDIPWSDDPTASWIYFDCTVGVMLDSGIVVHNRLPQINQAADTLASSFIDDPNMDAIKVGGVNLRCNDQYADIVQRMGHARYWFRLWGQALRAGYQIPIPGIRTVGGVPVVPYDKNPQWAFCRIAPGGNYSGVVMYHAQWSLWYTTLVPPTSNDIKVVDPAARITTSATPPDAMQAPYTQPDDNSVPVGVKNL